MVASWVDKALIGGGAALILVGAVGYATSGGTETVVAADTADVADLPTDDATEGDTTDDDSVSGPDDVATEDSMVEVEPSDLVGDDEEPDAEPPTSTPTTAPPDESAEDFLAQLTESVKGDRSFAIDRLGAATLDRYGADQCEAYVRGLDDATFDVTVREVGAPEPWDYTTDDLTTTIPDAIPVEVERVARGETVIQELHLTRADDGTLRWYSDCGDPR